MGHYGGSYKVSLGQHKKYGDMRVLDTPICGGFQTACTGPVACSLVHAAMHAHCACCTENGFMGMGIGASMTGLRPVIEGMNMGFLLLAFNQVRARNTAQPWGSAH